MFVKQKNYRPRANCASILAARSRPIATGRGLVFKMKYEKSQCSSDFYFLTRALPEKNTNLYGVIFFVISGFPLGSCGSLIVFHAGRVILIVQTPVL